MNLVRNRSLAVVTLFITLIYGAPLVAGDTSPAEPLERTVRDGFPTVAFDSEATFEQAQEIVEGKVVNGIRPLHGRSRVQDPRLAADTESTRAGERANAAELQVFYPSSYDGSFVVEAGRQRIALRPLGALVARGTTSRGKIFYERAYPSVDVIEVPSAGRSEEFLLLHDADAPHVYEYEIVEMNGVSAIDLVDGAIRFALETENVEPRRESSHGSFTAVPQSIQIDPPWLIDGNGRRSDTAARWTLLNETNSPRKIRLTIQAERREYPVLVDPSFSLTGTMTVQRTMHTSTLLQDGKVLIAGGPASNKAEIYDPATGISTATTGPMTAVRQSHSATLLRSGKVLLVAGEFVSSAEIFDPVAGTFTATAGALPSAARYHTATLLADGKVLIAGGQDETGYLDRALLFDPMTGSFTGTTGPMTAARASHSAVLLPNGKVLIAGGIGTSGGKLFTAELYDPATGTFTATSSTMNTQNANHTATVLSSGKVLIAGEGAELYDPVTDSFALTRQQMVKVRSFHTATLLPNGNVFIAGGQGFNYWDHTELYDPSTEAFVATVSMASARTGHAATLLPTGVLITGGSNGANYLNTIELYQFGNATFTATSTPMSSIRGPLTATPLPSGQILIAGGYSGSAYLDTAELFDPVSGTFSPLAARMTSPRGEHTATLLSNGKVLLVGGLSTGTNTGQLASAELYDPSSQVFVATSGSMASARVDHTATLLPTGQVLIAGGRTTGNGHLNTAELYDPTSDTFIPTNSPMTSTSALHPAYWGRAWHTATLLKNGQVLLTGGARPSPSGSEYLASAEIYDPSSATFAATSSQMNAARTWHTATLLPTGDVLLAGGYNGSFHLSTAEIYDATSGTFTTVASPMTSARNLHTATMLPDGKVLLAGSHPAFLLTADVYDPSSRRFSATTAAMTVSRGEHAATLLPSGQVLFTGGVTQVGGFRYHDSAERYDPGLGYTDAARPAITSIPAVIAQGSSVGLSGSLFEGSLGSGPEASSGGTRTSSTNYPLLQLRRIDNEETVMLPVDAAAGFSSTSFSSGTAWMVGPGPVTATIFANGIPSFSKALLATCAIAIVNHPYDQTAEIGGDATFSVTTVAASRYQWQRDTSANGNWVDIPGASNPTYTIPTVSSADSGSRYRVLVNGCASLISNAATLTVEDSQNPVANVVSPSGGEYWLLSIAGNPANSKIVTWSMSDDVRVCRLDVSLVYSDDGGATYAAAPSGGGLPRSFGAGGSCPYPGEMTTSLTYTIPAAFPSGRSGSLYRIQVVVTDQAGNAITARSSNPFYIVQANPDSVKTLLLSNVPRMITRQGISTGEAMTINGKLQELANHPRVQGLVVDLSSVTSINSLYAAWDADPADAARANAVLFGAGGIHEHLRTNLLPAYTGVKFLVLVGDDRIVPMARVQDRTALLPESTYSELSPTSTTVGRALAAGKYLSDDPLAVLDPITVDQLDGSLFLPDLAVGRLVETPQEITTTIATYIGQDGVLDLSLLDPATGHKVLVTGYDFLSNVSRQIRSRWKSALGVATPENSIAPVDGALIGGNWGLGSVALRTDALRTKIAGNGGARYGVMAISGHATHYEEGVPGTDPFDIQGLSTSNLYGTDACATPTAGAVELSGGVIYAVGCHGGLSVPGSCSTDENHSLDLPQTMLARGAVAYIANSGYGWGLKHGIGYGARLTQIFTEQMTSGGTINVGDAVLETKQRYYLETPRYDAYDEKTVMQWTLFGLPMYAVRSGIAAGSGLRSATQSRNEDEMIGAVRVTRTPPQQVRGGRALRTTPDALPPSLTQLNLSFDFTGAGVYTKYDSSGTALPSGPGCPDVDGCYYTLNGLVDRGTGSGDLPIQPYMIYDSRLSGSSQHGVLWKGGTYDEESGWKPIIAELVSNGGDGSNHGSTPRTVMIRPTAPRVVPGIDSPACRPSDLELNSLTVTTGEAIKAADETYSIARRYRNVDLEVFYFNDRNAPTNNCDRSGPSLGAGPFSGEYHQLSGSSVTWSIPTSDPSGTWRVLIVYTRNTVDAQNRGTWTPVELTSDGTGIFSGTVNLSGASRVTYVVQAVDNRGNVTWLDYVSAQLPSSGIAHGIPRAVEMTFSAPISAPANVTAGAVSSTSVSLTWSSVASATSYDIYRSASGTSYAKVGSSSGASYSDNTAAPNTAYLYAVKAIDAGANASGYSAPDLATTVSFTDPTITPGVSTIKAVHITDLRAAVNAVRVLAGSGSFPYVDPTIAPGVTTAKSAHITDLRTALAAARSDLSLPPAVYSGSAPDVGLPINAAHITELRGATQ